MLVFLSFSIFACILTLSIATVTSSISQLGRFQVRNIEKGRSILLADTVQLGTACSPIGKIKASNPARRIEARTPTMQKTKSVGDIPQQYMTRTQPSLQETQSSPGRISYSEKTNLESAESKARKARARYHKAKSEFDVNWQAQSNAHLPRPLDLGNRQYLLQDTHKIIAAKKAHMNALLQARTASLRADRLDRFARNNIKSSSALLTVGALQSQYQLKKDEIAKETDLDLLKHANEKYGPLHPRTESRRCEHKNSTSDVGASYRRKLAHISTARAIRRAGGRDTESSDSDASSGRSM